MCRASASPAGLPNPVTTLNTPAGRPASSASSATRIAVSGDCSAGLRTTLLPIASAGATFLIAMCSGKFHGVIAPTTPSGRSEEHTSELQSLMRISYAVFCLDNTSYPSAANTEYINFTRSHNLKQDTDI